VGLFLSSSVIADTLILKNGNRVEGTILEVTSEYYRIAPVFSGEYVGGDMSFSITEVSKAEFTDKSYQQNSITDYEKAKWERDRKEREENYRKQVESYIEHLRRLELARTAGIYSSVEIEVR